jgi:hypothetical protein
MPWGPIRPQPLGRGGLSYPIRVVILGPPGRRSPVPDGTHQVDLAEWARQHWALEQQQPS